MSALGAYFWLLQRRRPLASPRRLVDRKSWRELLENYDVAHGELWPVVPAFEGAAPAIAQRLRPVG
jgi:hypothetical protein